jgi:hypothetical protein
MAATGDERGDRFADRRIFVSVVAFSHHDVVATVRDALDTADRPTRLRFGICHLHDHTATDVDPFGDDPRIAVDRIPIDEGGPIGCARARTQLHYDSDPYVLQVDAPVRFAEGWDRRLVDQLESTTSARPMIADRLTPGLLFAHGRFVVDVPADPQMTEELEALTTMLRAYTHGYDVSWSNDPAVRRVGAARMSPPVDRVASLVARDRAERLIGGDDRGMGRYGLGFLRTIAAHEHHAGR